MLVTFRFSVAAFTPTFGSADRSNKSSARCSFPLLAWMSRGSTVPLFVVGTSAPIQVSPPRACASVDDFCTVFFSRAKPGSVMPRSRAKLIRQSTQVFILSHRSKNTQSFFFQSSGLLTTQSGFSGDGKKFSLFPRETPVAKYRRTFSEWNPGPSSIREAGLFYSEMGLAILGTTQPILFHCGTVNGLYKRGLSIHLTTEIYGGIASFLEGGKCSGPARNHCTRGCLAV